MVNYLKLTSNCVTAVNCRARTPILAPTPVAAPPDPPPAPPPACPEVAGSWSLNRETGSTGGFRHTRHTLILILISMDTAFHQEEHCTVIEEEL